MASRRPRGSRITRLVNEQDREFIELARKRFKQANDADTKQRQRELEDLEFYDGKQWDPLVLQAREGINQGNPVAGLPPVPARPSYVINKVKAPVRQILNQERQADLGVEIVAIDDFGDAQPSVSPDEIKLREGLVRKIQRDSQAADARSWAFQRAVIAGRGYYRIMTRYLPGKSSDQEVYVERIYNQASVSLDPAHEQPDGSDAEWGFIATDLPWDRYQSEYGTVDGEKNPLATASDSDWRALGDELPNWFRVDGELRSVRIVEYWYVTREQTTIHTLADGSSVSDDELPEDAEIADSRPHVEKRIRWAKIDGVQVLDETDWPGAYIPIVKVLGEEIQPYDSERRAVGMVRPSRDSQRGFNVMVSKWVEQVGLAPIPPWMGAAGFDEGFENEYGLSTTRTLPALHYNTRDLEGNPIPPPTRTSISMEIQAIAGSVELFSEAIKDTTQVPDATLGNVDPSLKTARGLKLLLSQSQQGTSHYLDNLKRSIRYEGIIENDLLFPVYGRHGRTVRVMDPRGKTQSARIQMAGQPATNTTAPNLIAATLTPDATFNVTITVDRDYDTRRQAQEDLLTSLVQASPEQMQVVGDLLFQYSDAPGHEELAERYKLVLAPPIQAALAGQQPVPPQMQAQMAQMQAQMQKLQQLADKNQADLQKTQIQEQAENVRSDAANQTALTRTEIQAAATMSVAQAKIDAENLRSYVDALESKLGHTLDLHMQKMTQLHEAVQNALDRQHDAGMAQQAHANTLEQGQQAANNQSALSAQNAAQQPVEQPETGA